MPISPLRSSFGRARRSHPSRKHSWFPPQDCFYIAYFIRWLAAIQWKRRWFTAQYLHYPPRKYRIFMGNQSKAFLEDSRDISSLVNSSRVDYPSLTCCFSAHHCSTTTTCSRNGRVYTSHSLSRTTSATIKYQRLQEAIFHENVWKLHWTCFVTCCTWEGVTFLRVNV